MCEEVSEAVVGGHSCQAGWLRLAPSSMSDEDAPSEGRRLHTLTTSHDTTSSSCRNHHTGGRGPLIGYKEGGGGGGGV